MPAPAFAIRLTPRRNGRQALAAVAAVAAGAVALALWAASDYATNYAEQVVLGISTGSLFALVALSLVLVYRSTEVVNFAQGEMATLSAFIAWSLLQWLGDGPGAVWAVLGLTAGIAFAIGGAMELLLIRRVQHAPVLSAVVVTLGCFAIFNSFSSWRYGSAPKPFPTPFETGTVGLGEITVSHHTLGVIAVCFAVMALVGALFNWTKLGLAMRATAESATASRLMGIPANRMLTLGWGLSASVGGVAGVLVAHTLNLSPLMMFHVLLFALVAAVIGGLCSAPGALVGGILVGVAQNVLGVTELLGGTQLRTFWVFAFMLLILLVRPAGLFGRPVARRL